MLNQKEITVKTIGQAYNVLKLWSLIDPHTMDTRIWDQKTYLWNMTLKKGEDVKLHSELTVFVPSIVYDVWTLRRN